jgi:transcription elongation factor SPT4
MEANCLLQRFSSHGCPNCESLLSLAHNSDTVQECTSANFNGVIALTSPERSWVAKWQRLDRYVPGTYAVQVIGRLPEHIVQELADKGFKYVPRDGTQDEGEGVEEE